MDLTLLSLSIKVFEFEFSVSYLCNRVYCIHVPGHDPITFSFRSFSFLIGWGVYGPIIYGVYLLG